MKKLNVLKVIDVWGWAYFFVGKEQQKYSKHNIIMQKYDEINLNNIDIIYIHSPNISSVIKSELPIEAKKKGIKIVGAYGGEINQKYVHSDLIVSISLNYLDYLKKLYFNESKVVFLPESVDSNFFTYNFNTNSFKVGYAGKLRNQIKRSYLLDQLKFPVVKQNNWGNQFFVENRTLKPMLDFYHSIDVLIVTSSSECMPRVILEAMACGLPVISTDVGSISLLLDSEWIVPVNPEKEVINQINNKLDLLKNNINLRKQVGERNRNHINKYFSWKRNQPLWDKVFELIMDNNDKQIEIITNNFINQIK